MNRHQALEDILKDSSKSVTEARRTVFNAFKDCDALSMKQLQSAVSGTMDRASVYRVVELFIELGILKRIQINWKYKLELSERFSDHHHHISCSRCGRVDILRQDDTLEGQIVDISNDAGYLLTRHSFDLVGICRRCQ